ISLFFLAAALSAGQKTPVSQEVALEVGLFDVNPVPFLIGSLIAGPLVGRVLAPMLGEPTWQRGVFLVLFMTMVVIKAGSGGIKVVFPDFELLRPKHVFIEGACTGVLAFGLTAATCNVGWLGGLKVMLVVSMGYFTAYSAAFLASQLYRSVVLSVFG